MERITQDRNTRDSLFTYLQTAENSSYFFYSSYVRLISVQIHYLLHPNKYNQCHNNQAPCTKNPHVIGHCSRIFFTFEQWRVRKNVGLKWEHSRVENPWSRAFKVLIIVTVPARSLWCPKYTWIQQKWSQGRNTDQLLPQTLDPEI